MFYAIHNYIVCGSLELGFNIISKQHPAFKTNLIINERLYNTIILLNIRNDLSSNVEYRDAGYIKVVSKQLFS